MLLQISDTENKCNTREINREAGGIMKNHVQYNNILVLKIMVMTNSHIVFMPNGYPSLKNLINYIIPYNLGDFKLNSGF